MYENAEGMCPFSKSGLLASITWHFRTQMYLNNILNPERPTHCRYACGKGEMDLEVCLFKNVNSIRHFNENFGRPLTVSVKERGEGQNSLSTGEYM